MTPSPAALELTDRIIDRWNSVTPESVRVAIAEVVEEVLAETREALKLAVDELTHATWTKGADQRGLKYAIEKCEAALAATEPPCST